MYQAIQIVRGYEEQTYRLCLKLSDFFLKLLCQILDELCIHNVLKMSREVIFHRFLKLHPVSYKRNFFR